MNLAGLAQLLEDPARAPFYDLLGGLADNLLTIGGHAGTFLECDACGDTFTLKGESWKCECCGREFELKFTPSRKTGSPFETELKVKVNVSGLTKPRSNPHWYYENENWSVAEFMMQILRLQPENFLPPWLKALGVGLQSPILEDIFCWPRFRFGGKTIQPDVAMGFEQDIVLFEFKRPGGGVIPAVEIMGQLCFAIEAAGRLGRRYHLLVVPGRESIARSAAAYIADAVAAADQTQTRWVIPEATVAEIRRSSESELAANLQVLGWETLLQHTSNVIRATLPESWVRENTLAKLRYFHSSRAEAGLFSPPPNETWR